MFARKTHQSQGNILEQNVQEAQVLRIIIRASWWLTSSIKNNNLYVLWDIAFSDRHWKAGAAIRGACIPKNTEAEYIPDILHVLGYGSLLTDRESQRAISRSASWLVILLRNFHSRS
jgi:hypothetical protein